MTAVELQRQVRELQAARITSAEGAALLERLAEAGMVERGQVVMLGLDAIRARFGERWARKGEQVLDLALAHIRRRLGPGDLAARTGEADVVIAVGGGREQAQGLGLAILQELLIFFLGEARPGDLRLNAVSWVSGREIGCVPIDPASLPGCASGPAPPGERPAFADPARPAPAPAPPAFATPPPSEWSALTLAVDQGRPLASRFVVQSLIGLEQGLPTGLRIDAQVRDQAAGRRLDPAAAGLSTAEALALDLATVDFASGLTARIDEVLTPLSFETVSTSRGRGRVLARAGASLARSPILEIVGVDAGTPHGRLTETATLAGRACQAVVARIALDDDVRSRLRAVAGARLGGLSIELGACPPAEAEERMARFAALARRLAPRLIAFSLPDHAALEKARALGFSHATLAAGD